MNKRITVEPLYGWWVMVGMGVFNRFGEPQVMITLPFFSILITFKRY